MKKVLSLLTAVIMLLSAVPAFAAEDTTPPTIDYSSLSISLSSGKNTVTQGDTVTVSINASDDSGIDRLIFFYFSPSHSEKAYEADYDSGTQKAVINIPITENTEAGTWFIYSIGAADIYDNQNGAFNSANTDKVPEGSFTTDLSAGDFTVEEKEVPPEPTEDNPPVIDADSLQISLPDGKTSAIGGDKVKLSITVTDESKITDVKIYYFFKASNRTTPCSLSYNDNTKKYEGELTVNSNELGGTAVISRIYAVDKFSNETDVYNSEFSESGVDLSAGNFRVMRSLSSVYVSDIPDYEYTGKEIKPEPFISDEGRTLTDGEDYFLSYQNNIKAGKATLIITGTGSYVGSLTRYFNITSQPSPTPTPAKVTKPKATRITKLIKAKGAFTVKWKKIGAIKGYEIQYSTSSKFKKAKIKRIKKAKTIKCTIKKLSRKKKYYVRVRTYKIANGKRVYSKWSAKKSITTK